MHVVERVGVAQNFVAQRQIAEALDKPILVTDFAAVAGIRERAFSLALREATGLPVYQFVLRRRVERAVELLQTSDMSLAEVAQRTGFTQ